MKTGDYVSFRLAKLLKEKGFDELCSTYYIQGRGLLRDILEEGWSRRLRNSKVNKSTIVVPTLQEAINWFRKELKIHIRINPVNPYVDYGRHNIPKECVLYYADIVYIGQWDTQSETFKSIVVENFYDTPAQAYEAAMTRYLETLA